MHVRVIVYEDPGWQQLLPLVYVRATFQLLCGVDRSPVADQVGSPRTDRRRMPETAIRLAWKSGAGRCWRTSSPHRPALPANQPLAGPALLLNGRGIWQSLPALDPGEASWVGTAGPQNRIACISADAALASQLIERRFARRTADACRCWPVCRAATSARTSRFSTGPGISSTPTKTCSAPTGTTIMAGVAGSVGRGKLSRQSERPFTSAGGRSIKPCVVIDAEDGPVWIGDNVTIFPHSYIQGPAFIGDGTA